MSAMPVGTIVNRPIPDPIDVIVPTIKPREAVASLLEEIIATAGMPVRVHATCTDTGASRNRNIGLDASTSNPVIMVDDDVSRFPENWAKNLVESLLARPNCMMMAARLMKPNGEFGIMLGWNGRREPSGIFVSPERRVCIACVAMRRTGFRFEEQMRGSGWEDNDMANQILQAFPEAEFCVNCDVKVVHANEAKNQFGDNWRYNQQIMLKKWGKL